MFQLGTNLRLWVHSSTSIHYPNFSTCPNQNVSSILERSRLPPNLFPVIFARARPPGRSLVPFTVLGLLFFVPRPLLRSLSSLSPPFLVPALSSLRPDPPVTSPSFAWCGHFAVFFPLHFLVLPGPQLRVGSLSDSPSACGLGAACFLDLLWLYK